MTVIKVSALGIVGVLLLLQIKQEKAGISLVLAIGISVLVFLGIIDNLEMIVNTVREISTYVQIENSYIITLIKMLGITYVAEFSSGICKDAGYQSIASQIELFGKITILVLSLPILLALLRTIQEFMT